MSEAGTTPPPTKPSRHQRSMAGMIGAMLITLLVILGFVALRGFTRDQVETEVPPVDYLDAVEGDEVTLDSGVADTWTVWTDEGGDTGYAAEVGDETVLVYGSAPAEDLEEVIALLQR